MGESLTEIVIKDLTGKHNDFWAWVDAFMTEHGRGPKIRALPGGVITVAFPDTPEAVLWKLRFA